MNSPHQPPANAGTPVAVPAAYWDELERVLEQMTDAHRAGLDLLNAQRAAIARADREELARLTPGFSALAGRLDQLRQQWATMAGSLVARAPTPHNRASGHAAPSLTTIVDLAPSPRKAKLSRLAADLRPLATRFAEQNAVVRRAADALLAHMQSLISQIARGLCPAGTYTRPAAPPPAAVVSALDLTS